MSKYDQWQEYRKLSDEREFASMDAVWTLYSLLQHGHVPEYWRVMTQDVLARVFRSDPYMMEVVWQNAIADDNERNKEAA